jgi:hypothetical protein
MAPSMGNSRQFALLASENPSDKYEYTSGLVFVGSFFLVFFFMWTLVVIVCRWLGPEHVGLWSGHAMERIEDEPTSFLRRHKIKLVRLIFCKAATLWMVFVIVFMTEGLNGLDEAKAVYNGSSTVSQLRNRMLLVPLLTITNSWPRHDLQLTKLSNTGT